MDNKKILSRAISRAQNYRSHKETKCKLLEAAFGSDTTIFDYDGVDELFDTICDLCKVMFPNLTESEIGDNVSWYFYEANDMDEPVVEWEMDGVKKSFIVNSPDVFYDMMLETNNERN